MSETPDQQPNPGPASTPTPTKASGTASFKSINPDLLALLPPSTSSETHTIRSKFAQNDLVSRPLSKVDGLEIHTMADLFPYAKAHHPHSVAMGKRRLCKIHKESKIITKLVNGKPVEQEREWTYFEMSPFSWMTTEEVADIIVNVGAGLAHLGMNPNDKMCISASTSREWQIIAHGCWSQSLCITTAYDTLGASGLLHSVNEAQVMAMFTNADNLDSVLTKIFPSAPSLRIIIYDGEVDADVLAKSTDSIKVISFAQLEALGTLHPCKRKSPNSTDLACIMYTSGSTGAPKGVELTHGNMVASIGGLAHIVDQLVDEKDVYLAYLPLAHIMELMLESYGIYKGMTLGYGSPKTLTDASMRNCLGDIKTLKPTVLTGVPAVWDSIKKGVEVKVRAMPRLVQAAFNAALKLKQMEIINGTKYSLVPDSLIFNKVRQETGGRLRIAVSGGAPLSANTHLFVSAVICRMIQGFGATESCGLSAARTPEYGFSTKNVGGPMPSLEIKLVDCPEAGYLASKNQGEVLLRGPTIMRGYYNRPDLTTEALTEDGWYRTGDIGQLQDDGTLSIIDRAKNLIKLANGEYVAVERLESVYTACHYIIRICVYADPDRNCIVALGNVNWPVLLPALKSMDLEFDKLPHEELCKHPDVRSFVLKDLVRIAKSNDMAPAEVIKSIVLCEEEWTPQNDMLTAAMKLQRRNIVKQFQAEINAAYAAL